MLGLNGLSHKGVIRKLASTLGVPQVHRAYWVNFPLLVKASVRRSHVPDTPRVRIKMVNFVYGPWVIGTGFVRPHGPLWSKASGPRTEIYGIRPFWALLGFKA